MITVFPLLRIRITSGEELYRWNLIEPMFFLMVAVEKRHLPANNIVISTMFIKLNSTVFECRYNLQVLGRFTGD